MSKGPDAFRTISEVADWLEVPTHVLRFWESRFTQVKPVKRAGGRRYYRPADMQLLGGIKRLLHDEGLTIRGVQKLLREEGVRHVAALAPSIDGDGWDKGSAKVITLNPVRPKVDNPPPDRWPFTDDAEQAVETLAAYLAEEDESQDERPAVANDDAPEPHWSEPSEGTYAADEGAGTGENAPEEEQPEAQMTYSRATPGDAGARNWLSEPPLFDENAALPPPLVITPLAIASRAVRVCKGNALSSALVAAEHLARAWDARA
ncbi:MerR family transcriptional regulator [Palleronia sp.]|uniref:MerR family transcriptional regulator n=1 Tax=Palleronia sp. TaxID=1940284 RepID=UPI0035C815CB